MTKNKTCYFLLKCNLIFLSWVIIKKISNKNKILFIDCGCNYGFYSFYSASLSAENKIFSIEASRKTSIEFLKNLELNKFINIKFENKAISNYDNQDVHFNESENDWESSEIHSG